MRDNVKRTRSALDVLREVRAVGHSPELGGWNLQTLALVGV
jgi:hypothetical protein